MKYIPPEEIIQKGDSIYNDRYRDNYEKSHKGEFLAIDIEDEKAYPGKYPEDAIGLARTEKPDGKFYLVKVGEETAFHIGHTGERHDGMVGSFQQTA